jgi:hypothetical protein
MNQHRAHILRSTVLDCIGYDNCTMAKPFKGTYEGKSLVA